MRARQDIVFAGTMLVVISIHLSLDVLELGSRATWSLIISSIKGTFCWSSLDIVGFQSVWSVACASIVNMVSWSPILRRLIPIILMRK